MSQLLIEEVCMIDFHTHILPGIDDGSKDLTETMAMLEEEKKQGVDVVVATPHFYARHSSVHHFLEKRRSAMEKVEDLLASHPGLPSVICGAEVYYFPGMGRADQLPQLTVQGTDLLMLEMPFSQWTDQVLTDVREILRMQELKVILVHLERFFPYQKDKRIWEEVLSLPIIVQVNTCALSEGFMQRRTALRMLKLGLPTVLGSDCHHIDRRVPDMEQGIAVIEKKLGRTIVEECIRLAHDLLPADSVREECP